MGNAHQVVVNDIGKVIGGIAVGFDQDHVIQLGVVHADIAVQLIVEGGTAFGRGILADHMGQARGQLLFHFLFGQMQAVLVIDVDLLAAHRLCQGGQALRRAEAVIGFAAVDQLFGVFVINARFDALALDIGAHAAVLFGAFIRDQACIGQGTVDDIDGTLHLTDLVRILDTEDIVAALMFGDQIGVQGCTKVADMHAPCGTGGISGSDFHILYSIPLSGLPASHSYRGSL